MIPTVLVHAHAAPHIHPETLAIAGACFALAFVAWRIVTGNRRRKAR